MIKLETNHNCLIGKVSDIIVYKDYIFINSLTKSRPDLYLFNFSGHFIRQIGNYGKGPTDYFYLTTIGYDSTTNRLLLADGDKILYYSIESEILNKGFNISNVEYISFINEDIYLISRKGKIINKWLFQSSVLYRYSKHFELKDSISIRESFSGGGFTAYDYIISNTVNGTYLYYPVINAEPFLRDTLYKLTGSVLKPELKLDFSKILVIKDTNPSFGTMSPDEFREAVSYMRNITIGNIIRTNRYIFSTYIYNMKQFLLCIDLYNNISLNMPEGFTDDLFGTKGTVNLIPLDLQKGEFCFIKYGYEVEGLIEGVTEQSNPVIFLLKLKNP